MRFEHTAVIPASRERVWDLLMDVGTVSACFPGVESVRQVDPEHFFVVQRVQVGPIRLRFEGNVTVTERDHAAGRGTMRIEGSDKATQGFVKATVAVVVSRRGPDTSELCVTAEAAVMGKLGEFGQPVMQRKADAMISEFAKNLGRRVCEN